MTKKISAACENCVKYGKNFLAQILTIGMSIIFLVQIKIRKAEIAFSNLFYFYRLLIFKIRKIVDFRSVKAYP